MEVGSLERQNKRRGVGEALMAIGNLVQVCLGWPAVGGGEAN